MSARGLNFIRQWTENNVDLTLRYRPCEVRAHVLAAACRLDARTALVDLHEIEDEIGDLEVAIARLLETRAMSFKNTRDCARAGAGAAAVTPVRL